MTEERVIIEGKGYALWPLIKHFREARRAACLPEGKDMYREELRDVIRAARAQREMERMERAAA